MALLVLIDPSQLDELLHMLYTIMNPRNLFVLLTEDQTLLRYVWALGFMRILIQPTLLVMVHSMM